MKIDISKYLQDRYQEAQLKSAFPGPVVTIAREIGCPSKQIATFLVEKLNHSGYKFSKKTPWRWISKEILEESAKDLGVDMAEIKYVFEYKTFGVLEDLLLSHSKKFYKSDRKVRNTIAKVIRNFADEGNAVIVGRGGVAITRDIPKSLHIKLEAPLEWRALRTSEKHNISIDEAKKYCLDIDKKREQFRDYFQGKGNDYTRFDITFNCMTIDAEEISEIIIESLRIRNLI
ncbi:MAG: cytidylate kinase-like family protein [Bacteroidales bacterium]|nr:cytidylate kinase-like family protein [Bacteroidales bacterium]MCB9013708.1 cytidylate kinase-like family protein [Bacteroidales bacterium]